MIFIQQVLQDKIASILGRNAEALAGSKPGDARQADEADVEGDADRAGPDRALAVD